MQKRPVIGGAFFIAGAICGIILVGTAIYRLDVISDSERVVARVVDFYYIDEVQIVQIEYNVGGTIFSTTMNWNKGNVGVGHTVEIFVNRQDPHRVVEAGIFGWKLQIILLPFTVVFGGFGVMMIHADIRSRTSRKWLLQHGTPVWANVQGILNNWGISVNGRPAIVLKAAYGLMQFTSDPLDNADLIQIGVHVKVLLHPEKPNIYAFDIHDESGLHPVNAPAPPSVRTQYERHGHFHYHDV